MRIYFHKIKKIDPVKSITHVFGLCLFIMTSSFFSILYAAPPAPFNGWVNQSGQISANCPVGFICSAAIVDDGMFQRKIRDINGNEFIQLVLDDTDPIGGSMTTESFIQLNGDVDGISTRQTITSIGANTLSSTAELNTGWANDLIGPSIQLNQTLSSLDNLGVGIESTFSFELYADANGDEVGKLIDVSERILDSSLRSATATTGTDIQAFKYRQVSGLLVQNDGTVTLPAATGRMGGMTASAGGTINWLAGDTVKVLWIGQICDGCQDGGGMGNTGGNAVFSYQMFDNLVDVSDPISTGSITSSDPFEWLDPPFGLLPTI